MIAHAIRLLKPFVPTARAAQWEYDVSYFDPFYVYRYGPGVNNWNVVAACGEALFQMMGIRKAGDRFVEASFAGQGDNFESSLGLYLEEAMPYDHFPRLWIADLLARGYNGPYSQELDETLRRASLVSLFMQSPTGELPSGGRSAHHQWNEAQQCVTYEVYAGRALANGDTELAAYFKRAAHLSLQSMRRWCARPARCRSSRTGWTRRRTMATKRIRLTPSTTCCRCRCSPPLMSMRLHGSVAERPAPADLGGFVFEVTKLNKVFANAGGAYVELDTKGDHAYDATGLIRVHFSGHSPQLGTSDSVLAKPKYLPTAGGAPTRPVSVSRGRVRTARGATMVSCWRARSRASPC
jgi:hypothetical protein